MHDHDDFNEDDVELSIFISHGNSNAWKDVDNYIRMELDLPTLVLSENEDPGRLPIEKLDDETNDCFFGIVVIAKDDDKSDSERSRQNLLYEIGFLQGKFGIENVLVLKEDGVDEYENIPTISYESFSANNIKSTFPRVMQELDLAIDAVENSYHEEND